MSKPPLRVALLYDDRVTRQDIIQVCTADRALALVAVKAAATTQEIIATRADVLLLDSRLPNALDICTELAHDARPAVIFVDVPRDEKFASSALHAGARGLVFEDDPAGDAVRAIHLVHLGGVWAPRKAVLAALRAFTQAERDRRREAMHVILERLSPREIEVMQHAAAGLGNKELAERLSISRSTVKAHLARIFQKLGVQGRVELTAAYHSLVPSEHFGGLLSTYNQSRRSSDRGRQS